MRVLILSCNTGGGHNACAGAIQKAFSERGYPCDIADSIGFVSDKLSKFMSWGHTTMYRHIPGLFQFGYGFAEKHPSMLKDDAAAYKLLTGGTELLYSHLQEGGYDTVVCTHVFSGMLLRQMLKEHPLPLKTAFVGTDYTCSPGTAKSELDWYFIPMEALKEEFVAQGVPAEKLIPSGIPVKKEFYEQRSKEEAKQKLGLDPDCTHLLMMCGSMGCGPMERLTKLLSAGMDEKMELSVVCGTNDKLRRELTEEFGSLPNVHIHGFVKEMNSFMDSADLYLTKPGGLSTTEAAAKCLPMVFIDAVAGCEEYNLRYFTSIGGAVTADTPEQLAQLCLRLMRDKERLAEMEIALETLPKQNAAQVICETMCAEMKAGGL